MSLPRAVAVASVVCLLATLGGCDFLRGYAEGHSTNLTHYETQDLPSEQMGAARFVFDDFGALSTDTIETSALPWKLVAAALVRQRFAAEPATEARLREVLQGFGFLYPERIGNWPLTDAPQFRTPLGIVSGVVRRDIPRVEVEVANLACASCHAGVTYDAEGVAQRVAWLGMPNTSLDLDAYDEAVFGALRQATRDRAATFAAIRQIFPDISEAELDTLRDSIWPRMLERFEAGGESQPFRNGGPGRSNAVEALKRQFHLAAGRHKSAAGVSIPQVGDQALRWSVLVDGLYTRRGDPRFQSRAADQAADSQRTAEMVALFTVPTMGLPPEKAPQAVDDVAEVLSFLAHFQPPKYPGTIDPASATRGAVIFARCAECHGEYVERDDHLALRSFPNRLSKLAEIGTDPARLEAVNEYVIDAVGGSPMGKFIDAQETHGYVAPNLAGIWATAPYLHNGSVPTLRALMTPAERPAKFWVGGHRLDFVRMGIAGEINARGEYAYPASYLPWSTPRLFDTAEPGHSNRGHEHEFDGLTDADKTDLIEFMKQL